MLTHDEALRRILDGVEPLSQERLPIQDSLGLVLAEDITAAAPIPAFRNSAMDGYALRFEDLPTGVRRSPYPPHEEQGRIELSATLRIVDVVPAGTQPKRLIGPGEAAQILTGAMMPDGADTVVPLEDCAVSGDELTISQAVRPGQFVRLPGEDVAAGALVAKEGLVIGPGAIAMFAATGRATVKIYRRPRVAIITTGNELVTPGESLRPGQIYNSNGYALAAQIAEAGGLVTQTLHATDDRASLRAAFDACEGCDVLVTSGGVSVGEFDYVKEIFAERGTIDFWKIAIRPGKPLAYGRRGDSAPELGNAAVRSRSDMSASEASRVGVPAASRDTRFFGLPGNPVSSMVTFELFVRPTLRKMLGHATVTRPMVRADLAEPIEHEPGRRSFLRVHVTRENGGYRARLAGGQASSMIHGIVHANGLLILNEDISGLAAGDKASVLLVGPVD